MNSWMQINRLSLNVEKTFFMLIHNKKHEKDIHVQLNGIEIKRVESVKYLGVIIDQKLQWKAHVDQVAKKLSKCLWAICRLRKYADIKTLSLVYYALAYPHLQYCISSWGGAAQKHLNILLVKQKRLLRLMLKQPFDSPSKPLFKKLFFLQINDIYEFQIGKLMFYYKNNLIKFPIKLQPLEHLHSHNTRSITQMNYARTHNRTNIGINSFSSIGPKI